MYPGGERRFESELCAELDRVIVCLSERWCYGANLSYTRVFLLLFSSTKFSSFYIISVYGQTEAVKDMEAKLEEQEQNKLYLDQLLAMLKDRDPTLLHVINSSLASR